MRRQLQCLGQMMGLRPAWRDGEKWVDSQSSFEEESTGPASVGGRGHRDVQALVLRWEAGVGTAGDEVMESSATYVEMPIRWPGGEGVGLTTWIQESVVSRVFRGLDVTPRVRVWLTTAWAEGTSYLPEPGEN